MSDIRQTLNLEIKHGGRRSFRRPEITVMVDDTAINEGCDVTVQLSAEFGQPMRWLEITPDEARALALALQDIAKRAEDERKRKLDEQTLDPAVPF
jgi:hypothetical protein